MYAWLITWTSWGKIVDFKEHRESHRKTSVFPILHQNNWNVIKREAEAFFCLGQQNITEEWKAKVFLLFPSSRWWSVREFYRAGSFTKGHEGRSLPTFSRLLPVTSNECILHWVTCSQAIRTVQLQSINKAVRGRAPQAEGGNDGNTVQTPGRGLLSPLSGVCACTCVYVRAQVWVCARVRVCGCVRVCVCACLALSLQSMPERFMCISLMKERSEGLLTGRYSASSL